MSAAMTSPPVLELSPAAAALAHASVKVAARPGEVSTGALRIRVLQITDLPPESPAAADSAASSWLRYPVRRQANGRPRGDAAVPGMACILLKTAAGAVLATETRPWATAISWNEEFLVERVDSTDELRLFCVDRAKNEPHFALPLRDDAATTCPGFLGKVCIPLSRLPEGEEIEQWYPLIPKNSYISLRTALRVSLCFMPAGKERLGGSRDTRLLSPPSEVSSSPSPVAKHLSIQVPPPSFSPHQPPSPSLPRRQQREIELQTGVLDYVIVVGGGNPSYADDSVHESVLRFRYPPTDRPHFPLPTKIEWFCFPGGPEVIVQPTRPRPRTFSFVLVGGADGLSRCYVVCLVVYHQAPPSATDDHATTWVGTCLAFLTRLPLIEEITACLLGVAHSWLAGVADRRDTDGKIAPGAAAEKHIAALCHEILVPIRGLFGVAFPINKLRMELVLPSTVSLYSSVLSNGSGGAVRTGNRTPSTHRGSLYGRSAPATATATSTSAAGTTAANESTAPAGGGGSPTRSSSTHFINIQYGLQPLVYSLAPVFELLDVKTIIHIVALLLCEYRVVIHSTQLSLLTPVAEGLCALIYPFRWQHPYVPILPRVLSEYLQAPLPYILGVHSSWLPGLLELGRPEHLVLVDIDRGSIHVQEPLGPMLPHRFARGLHRRVTALLRPCLSQRPNSATVAARIAREGSGDAGEAWSHSVEKQIRLEFVCFLSAILMGYRECLFFVNQKLPVFNKRRFFANCAPDSDVAPFVTKLFCTQAFQAFLENHSSSELSVFHSVYLRFCRANEVEWPDAMPSIAFATSTPTKKRPKLGGGGGSSPAILGTPIYEVMKTQEPSAMDPADAAGSQGSHDNTRCGDEDADGAGTGQSDDDDSETVTSLGCKIDALLDKSVAVADSMFTLDVNQIVYHGVSRDRSATTERHDSGGGDGNRSVDYHQVAHQLGVDPRVFEENAHAIRDPHYANQNHCAMEDGVNSNGVVGSGRLLSSEEEHVEQILHRCLTSVFASDDALSADEIRSCELRFKSAYARELLVLILMQPSHQYVESGGGTGGGSTWYNPKGSGSCIAESGFRLLSRLASAMMTQCAVHEDFTNARGMLQVASQYYHYVEDKHSGIGFAKKEYLVTPLRALPICRSLDMWQHAFSREVDWAIQADPSAAGSDDKASSAVGDELFFSVIGSMVYDMLSFEVPLPKVHTFVAVMCATYQKGKDLLDTLKQLVENVYRALDMSKDIKPSPPKSATATRSPFASTSSAAPGQRQSAQSSAGPLSPVNGGVPFNESPVLSRQYDLDTVIRRKMSVNNEQQRGNGQHHSQHQQSMRSTANRNGSDAAAPAPAGTPPPLRQQRGPSSTHSSSATGNSVPFSMLSSHGAPILAMSIDETRVACALGDASVAIADSGRPDRVAKLEGHTDAVVAVQLRGYTLLSGARDGTLRSWDLRATVKKRHLFSFFSSSTSSTSLISSATSNEWMSGDGDGDAAAVEIDGAAVSKRSLVLRGHSGGVTCLEIGRQLTTDRALVASGSDDGTVRLWESTRETSVGLLASNGGSKTGGVSCLRFLPLIDNLASGCRSNLLRIWDLSRAELKLTLRGHRGALRDIQITGDRLVTAANDRVVKVWDATFRSGGNNPTHALREHGGPVLCVALGGPADPSICTGAADGIVRVWDLRYVQKGPRLCLRAHSVGAGGGAVTCLQRDFTRLVSAGEDGGVRVWDLHSGACATELRAAHNAGVTSLALRDALVFSSSWDGSLRLWDVQQREFGASS